MRGEIRMRPVMRQCTVQFYRMAATLWCIWLMQLLQVRDGARHVPVAITVACKSQKTVRQLHALKIA